MCLNQVALITLLVPVTPALANILTEPPTIDIRAPWRARSVEDAAFNGVKRRDMACGNSTGVSCLAGQCCGLNGYCGTGVDYCKAPDCQFAFGPACDANAIPSGSSTLSVPRPLLGSVQYGGVTIKNCVVPGTVAMSYDDGPGPYTSQLLDILAKSKVKATFFITGNNNGKGEIDSPSTPWPQVIRRIHAEGHQVASHTWSHADLDRLTTAQRTTELIKNEMAFINILGFFPTYMRPPFTSCSDATGCTGDIAKLGYHIVDFMIDTKDYLNQSPELIQNSKNIFAGAFANANPQTQEYLPYAHDIHEQSVVSLTPYIINTVLSRGFRMVTVGECLNDPSSNWYRDPNTGGALSSVPALAAVAASTSPNPPAVTTTLAASSTALSSFVATNASTSGATTHSTLDPDSVTSSILTLTGTVGTFTSNTHAITTSHISSKSTQPTATSQAASSSATPKPDVAARETSSMLMSILAGLLSTLVVV